MRWLFPSRTPFIPSKCYASLYRNTTAPTIFALHFSTKHISFPLKPLLLPLNNLPSRE